MQNMPYNISALNFKADDISCVRGTTQSKTDARKYELRVSRKRTNDPTTGANVGTLGSIYIV